jgi:hypothetical protein
MAFTRFHDDSARIIKALDISTYSGRYALNVPGNGTNPAYMQDPHMRLQKWGGNAMTHATEIENNLFGLTRNLNRDTFDNLYRGGKHTSMPSGSHVLQSGATVNSYTDQSRATNPAWMLRDAQQYRPEYPLFNPQEHTAIPFQNNLSTRILEKDYFVPAVPNTMHAQDVRQHLRQSVANAGSDMEAFN